MKSLLPVLFAALAFSTPALATVTVTSPVSGTTVTSPVHYVASATTSTCSQGVASVGVYINNKLTYVENGSQLDANIALGVGQQQTVVEEWDYCGGATYVPVNLTVQSSSATVTVTSPAGGATVTSPVHYVASATTNTCSQGVASVGVYVNNKLTYVENGSQLDANIAMGVGQQQTVVEEWDYCGGATYVPVDLTVEAAAATVTVTSPASGATVTSPVQYVASATTNTCSQGVASVGVYVNNKLIYVENGSQLNASIAMSAGQQQTVVEEWDYCGGATYVPVNLTVEAPADPTVTISPRSSTITSGSTTPVTVSAVNATSVTVTGTDGSSYTLSASGGSFNVEPSATTTYTAEVSGSGGEVSASTTVSVIPANSLQAINHVVFMLQENHSFDNYFGMLNPYRQTNGWNVGDDGKTYNVDGIDDKLSSISNQDDEGTTYTPYKFTSTCVDDMSSDWVASYGDANRYNFLSTRPILMDGFVHNAEGYAKSCQQGGGTCSGAFTDTIGERAMGYYDESFLNYYYYMASQFALSDRWFSPVSSKSIANRIATFTGGTTNGLVRDPGLDDHLPQQNISTIFQELDNAGVSWKIYYTVTEGFCLEEDDCTGSGYAEYPATDFSDLSYSYQYLYENTPGAACNPPTQPSTVVGDPSNSFCIDTNHIAPLSQYYQDLTNNTLPSFAFIEAGYGNNDEHPGSGQSILEGQAEVAQVVNSLMGSPAWSSSVFFLGYDEGGGPYDHVPPVPGYSNINTDSSLGPIPDISMIAINADSYNPCPAPNGVSSAHCDLTSGNPGMNSSDAAATEGFAAQLGFRIPNMVISPFTRKHYVSHTPMDHTAIIKFVENRFIGSSAYLTSRDAVQTDLLEFFDFTKTPWATPPTPPSPVTQESLGYDPCTPATMGP